MEQSEGSSTVKVEVPETRGRGEEEAGTEGGGEEASEERGGGGGGHR